MPTKPRQVQKVRTRTDEAMGIRHYGQEGWPRTACGRLIVSTALGARGAVSADYVDQKSDRVNCITCQKAIERFGW